MMETEDALPEGVTLNADITNSIDLDLQNEIINTIKCNFCDVRFESVLITLNSRHEGIIRIAGRSSNVWKNSLPKDRNRCIAMLEENLKTKLDKHKERDHND